MNTCFNAHLDRDLPIEIRAIQHTDTDSVSITIEQDVCYFTVFASRPQLRFLAASILEMEKQVNHDNNIINRTNEP